MVDFNVQMLLIYNTEVQGGCCAQGDNRGQAVRGGRLHGLIVQIRQCEPTPGLFIHDPLVESKESLGNKTKLYLGEKGN